MIVGRGFYEASAKMWQSRPGHPRAHRLNTMAKYVFSFRLKTTEWGNSTVSGYSGRPHVGLDARGPGRRSARRCRPSWLRFR
jgi:hypothetical protein